MNARVFRPGGAAHALAGWVWVAPSLTLVGVFFFWPLAYAVWISGHVWPLFGRARWNDWANYRALLDDEMFWRALGFTLRYTAALTPILFAVAFLLALLANSERRGVEIFRTIWFLPTAIGLSTASVLWAWMLNGDVGIFTPLMRGLGLVSGPIPYLDNATNALVAASSMVIWKTAGFNMVLFLLGLQSIPRDVVEAARIDGAGPAQTFLHVTLPLMKRTILLALALSVIGSLLAFEQFYVITRGGPQNATMTLVYWIFHSAFVSFRIGYASALSIALLVIVLTITALQFVLLRERRGA
jgi:multiple sugar transport system permease protein